jgi:hypothetical protein
MRRDWLTGWLFGVASEAHEQPAPPTQQWADEMSGVLLLQWATDEALWWRQASLNPRLTVAQRTLRLRVAMFYEERATALSKVDTSHGVTEEEPCES